MLTFMAHPLNKTYGSCKWISGYTTVSQAGGRSDSRGSLIPPCGPGKLCVRTVGQHADITEIINPGHDIMRFTQNGQKDQLPRIHFTQEQANDSWSQVQIRESGRIIRGTNWKDVGNETASSSCEEQWLSGKYGGWHLESESLFWSRH